MATTARYVRRRPPVETSSVLSSMAVAFLGGLGLFVAVVFAISTGYSLLYAGRIFPGVSVAGVDLSGLKPGEAAIRLSSALTYPYNGKILFQDGDKVWMASPAQLGMVLDPGATAQMALSFGRSFNIFQNINDQLNSAQVGMDLPPVTMYDERLAQAYLKSIASQVDRPVTEASFAINGLDVVAQPGQVGRILNVDASLVYLRAQMQTFRDGAVPLVIQEKAPEILDVSSQAEIARRLLSSPFVIAIPDAVQGDPGPWQIAPQDLAAILRVSRIRDGAGAAQYRLELDQATLETRIREIARQVDRHAQNSRFTFNDDTRQLDLIQSAAIGRSVDVEATVQAVEEAVSQGQPGAYMKLNITQPQVGDTATAQQLGITQLISAQTTYFRGSSSSRMQNIQTAAAKFHGVLVAPGETFSMGETLGDVSLDSGYAEALIIYGGRTIKGVGGGVCQVSTTLFRTAFFAGFPVVERYAHAYRVYYYEQSPNGGYDPNLAGFDATVYFPVVDFKFVNDSPYWLLMETYFNPQSYTLTWKFYSTSDGRTVTFTNSGPQNVVPAPNPEINFNPDLAPGEFKQVDYASDGADVTIERTVLTRDGKILFVDRFVTHYQPWAAVCEYGPDVDDPLKIAKRRGLCWNKQ